MGCVNDDVKILGNKIQERGGIMESVKLPKKAGYDQIQNIGGMIDLKVRGRVPLMC